MMDLTQLKDIESQEAFWNAKAKPCSAYERRSEYAQEFLEKSGLLPGESVFDMGCGSGQARHTMNITVMYTAGLTSLGKGINKTTMDYVYKGKEPSYAGPKEDFAKACGVANYEELRQINGRNIRTLIKYVLSNRNGKLSMHYITKAGILREQASSLQGYNSYSESESLIQNARKALEQAINIAHGQNDRDTESAALGVLAYYYYFVPAPDRSKAEEYANKSVALGDVWGNAGKVLADINQKRQQEAAAAEEQKRRQEQLDREERERKDRQAQEERERQNQARKAKTLKTFYTFETDLKLAIEWDEKLADKVHSLNLSIDFINEILK